MSSCSAWQTTSNGQGTSALLLDLAGHVYRSLDHHHLAWRVKDTILDLAVYKGSNDWLQKALHMNLDVNQHLPVAREMPLMLVTRRKDKDRVKAMLEEKGINILCEDFAGCTPLERATLHITILNATRIKRQ